MDKEARLKHMVEQIEEALAIYSEKQADFTYGEAAAFLSGILLLADFLAKHDGHEWINAQIVATATVEVGKNLGMIHGKLSDGQ